MRRTQLERLIGLTLEAAPGLSDIIITPGKLVQAECAGELKDVSPFGLGKITAYQCEALALTLLGDSRRLSEDLRREGSCDLAYEIPGLARFRVNVFRQRESLSLVLRRLPDRPPSLEELKLPVIFHDLAELKNGLVLVTGATGSGKSCSLAALLDAINSSRAVHILTLEDPVEFIHQPKLGTISQRELGTDFSNFADGLRAALRQSPKVILVGELRDRESLDVALAASETGHLVLGTLHTADAGQSVNRILGLFPPSEERILRQRLAASLKCVISQRLVPKIKGGLAAAFEVLCLNLRVHELILEGESEGKTFRQAISQGEAYKMTSFDASLLRLYRTGEITQDTALAFASDRAELGRGIDSLKSSRGEAVSDIGELRLDPGYGLEG